MKALHIGSIVSGRVSCLHRCLCGEEQEARCADISNGDGRIQDIAVRLEANVLAYILGIIGFSGNNR